MNALQIIGVTLGLLTTFTGFAVVALALLTVHQEQRYKLRLKYGPKTDAEFEQRVRQLLREILDERDKNAPPY